MLPLFSGSIDLSLAPPCSCWSIAQPASSPPWAISPLRIYRSPSPSTPQLLVNRPAGITSVGDLAPQLRGWPLSLGGGDAVSLLLPLLPTLMVTDPAATLGTLQLTWSRSRDGGREMHAAVAGEGDREAALRIDGFEGPSPNMTVRTRSRGGGAAVGLFRCFYYPASQRSAARLSFP